LASHSQDASGFDTVSDSPRAQDVLLRRRAGSEEVLVSALLAPLQFVDQDPLPRAALIKVFVSKPGATPVLHFDCRASWVGEEERGAADYAINAVRYHSSPGTAGEDEYEGPEFRWCSYALLVLIFIFVFKNSSLDVCCCFICTMHSQLIKLALLHM
jgi:complement component 1 Q subcomponent-binding protein